MADEWRHCVQYLSSQAPINVLKESYLGWAGCGFRIGNQSWSVAFLFQPPCPTVVSISEGVGGCRLHVYRNFGPFQPNPGSRFLYQVSQAQQYMDCNCQSAISGRGWCWRFRLWAASRAVRSRPSLTVADLVRKIFFCFARAARHPWPVVRKGISGPGAFYIDTWPTASSGRAASYVPTVTKITKDQGREVETWSGTPASPTDTVRGDTGRKKAL